MKPLKIVGILCLFMVLFLSFGGVEVYAVSVEAVYGSTPTINGIMAPGEWIDASTVTFSGPSGTCTVYVKQDVTHLNVAIHVPDNTVDQFDWFEVCLDTNHDHGSRPQTDDYHLTMTRGFYGHIRQESVGDGLNWVSQATSGWTSSAAWTNSDYTIELSIDYAKLGITAGVAKTLGIEFLVWDDSGSTKYRWTAGSDNSNPSTWSEVTSYWFYPIHQGDLVIAGNNVTVIEGRFDINGSIIVEENATLILRNAVINFMQVENYQFRIILQNPANGSPSLQSENATITSSQDYWFLVSLFGNSTATISNSTITAYLNIQDSANASVSDSEIRFLVASKSAFLLVSNCTISYTLQADHSSTVLVSNSTITKLNLELDSVNCSITNFGPGQFPFWNFVLNCSATVSPDGYAPNITIIHSTISVWQLSMYGKSNATITDSTIGTLFSYDNTIVWLVNSTALHIQYTMEGKIYVSWYLDIHVTDSIDQDVPSANVTATYPNATVVESKLADANGWLRFTLVEKMMNATGEYPVGNYTVEATYEIFSDVKSVNMTENQQITLALEGFVIPEFPSFLLLPLFMIATLLAVIVCRKKHPM